MRYLMGIDLGTSSVKTLLLSESGKTIAVSAKDYPVFTTHTGIAEQDPQTLWNAAAYTIAECLKKAKIRSHEIAGISFSGQMHGLIPLDIGGNPLRPAIIWMDQRSAPLTGSFEKLRLEDRLCNPAVPGFLGPSLLWMKQQEPERYQKTAVVLLPKDYIRYRITGTYATDPTDAAGTLLYDFQTGDWCREALEKLALNPALMPPILPSCAPAGTVTPACAEITGLHPGTPVICGGGDQAMHTLGNGIYLPDSLTTNIGTAGQATYVTDRLNYAPKLGLNTFCHAKEGLYSLVGATLNGGLALKWLKDQILHIASYEELNQKAAACSPGSSGIIFLPYLCGERTPHKNPKAKGMFFGCGISNGESDFIRSVMEGVVYSLKDCIALFERQGLHSDTVTASGGGAKSALWLQMQADILNKEIRTAAGSEQACLGAAITAAVGCGMYASIEEACRFFVTPSSEHFEPITENVKIYEDGFHLYRQLYENNKELFN